MSYTPYIPMPPPAGQTTASSATYAYGTYLYTHPQTLHISSWHLPGWRNWLWMDVPLQLHATTPSSSVATGTSNARFSSSSDSIHAYSNANSAKDDDFYCLCAKLRKGECYKFSTCCDGQGRAPTVQYERAVYQRTQVEFHLI